MKTWESNVFFHDGYHPNADTWTTGRTITIGNTGKSVNGSANVSWTLAEIGAAASSHNHDGDYIQDGGTTAIGDINTIGTESIKHRWNNTTVGRPAEPQANEYGTITTLTYDTSYATQLAWDIHCLLYTSPSPRDGLLSRMPSSA